MNKTKVSVQSVQNGLYLVLEGEIPGSVNQSAGRNPWVHRTTSKKWKKMINQSISLFLPDNPYKKAKIKIVRHSSVFLDFDNLVAGLKPVCDGLLHLPHKGQRGLILSDSWASIGAWEIDQKKRPRSDGKMLEIWIEDQSNV